MASQQPCLSCACTNPRLLSDVLGAIHIKRGQVREAAPLPSCRERSLAAAARADHALHGHAGARAAVRRRGLELPAGEGDAQERDVLVAAAAARCPGVPPTAARHRRPSAWRMTRARWCDPGSSRST